MTINEKGPLRVAAIHDLAGFGRCALSVVMPVLSAMNTQVCPIPTAVLSTHTGGLGDVVMRDLTDFLSPCLEHYKKLGISFDCIYSGFLGSHLQAEIVERFQEAFPAALSVVDPVMGDHGKLYRTCTPELRTEMKKLVKTADVITPNITEAYMLLGEEHSFEPLTATKAKSLLVRLAGLGPRFVVVTSAGLAAGGMANIGYDKEKAAFWKVGYNQMPVSYPGTGDIFAAVLVGSLLGGQSLPMAVDRATRFIETSIRTTYSFGTDPRFGVMFETALPALMSPGVTDNYETL